MTYMIRSNGDSEVALGLPYPIMRRIIGWRHGQQQDGALTVFYSL